MEKGPKRSHMSGDDIEWRCGAAPDYTSIDEQFMAERTKRHEPDSLEEVVQNLVKTWEMEIAHKLDPRQWKTVDYDRYRVIVNGARSFNIKESAEIGTYNMLMCDTPFYDSKNHTFESSHKLFRKAFNGHFPWEVLEVFSGPPKVAFTWRHWGTWSGEYGGISPSGETVELRGLTVATVTEELLIQTVDTYYDPNPFLLTFLSKEGARKGRCPFHRE